MTTTYAPFDAADYLKNDDEESIADFLSVAAEDPNPDVLLSALAAVAKARGMTLIAKDTGRGRESLYKALAPGSHPRFETVSAILRALNMHLVVVPNHDRVA
jgi:probable addiction module antidote protein